MKKYFLIVVLILISPVYALQITNFNATNEIWLNENSIFKVSLNCDEGSNVYTNITGNNYSRIINLLPAGSAYGITTLLNDISFNNPYFSNTICAKDNSTDNVSNILNVNKLNLDIKNVSISSSPTFNNPLYIVLNYSKNTNIITFNSTFTAFLDSNQMEIKEIKSPMETLNSLWLLTVALPNKTIYNGTLIINAINNGKNVNTTYNNKISVRPLLEANLVNTETINLISEKEINFSISVKYLSENLTKNSDVSFKAVFDGSDIEIKNYTAVSDGLWMLIIKLPKKTPKTDSYELDLTVVYNSSSVKTKNKLYAKYLAYMEGTVDYLATNKKDIDILFTKNDKYAFRTQNGDYKINLTSGYYNAEFYFPNDINVELSNADISNVYNNAIDYNYVETSDYIKGFYFNFLPHFDKAIAKVKYLNSDFSNENSISVLKCDNWDNVNKKCNGEMKKIDAVIDTQNNLITFDISSSYYFITEESPVEVTLTSSKTSYLMNENIEIIGTVLNKKGPLKNEDVVYSSGLGSGVTNTDSIGSFKINMKAEKSGVFDFTVKSHNLDKTISIKIEKKKSAKIYPIDDAKVAFDKEYKINATIENDGDDDIEITASVSPDKWAYIKDNKLKLSKNEKKTIEISFNISKKDCEVACAANYNKEFKIDGSVSKSISFNLYLIELDEKTNSTNPSLISTGFAVSDGNILYGSAAIFIAIISFVLYKKFIPKNRKKKDLDKLKFHINN